MYPGGAELFKTALLSLFINEQRSFFVSLLESR